MKKIIIGLICLFCLISCYNNDSDNTPTKWPNNEIRYKFKNISEENKNKILEIMNEIESFFNIKFKKSEKTKHVLKIMNGNSNSSSLGYKKYPKLILYNFEKHIIRHELFHILGFTHEHQRPDRDNYLIISSAVYRTDYKKDMEKLSEEYFIYDYTHYLYDIKSISHYTSFFMGDGLAYFLTKKSKYVYPNETFSELDIQKINEIYQ